MTLDSTTKMRFSSFGEIRRERVQDERQTERVKMRKEDETGSTEETLTFTFFLVLEQLTSYLFLFPSCSSCSAIVF